MDTKNEPLNINIIGDIAGRYDEFLLLLKKMPKADLIIAAGDLIDRGPKSKQVLDWFMNTDNAIAIYGNHENMMVEYYRNPLNLTNANMWLRTGGMETLESFKVNPLDQHVDIPVKYIEWLEKCPIWWQNDELIVSHCPIIIDLDEIPGQYERHNINSFIWNFNLPYKRPNSFKFQIHGHNGRFMRHSDSFGDYGICIDHSDHKKLVGLQWPTKEIFSQDYLD